MVEVRGGGAAAEDAAPVSGGVGGFEQQAVPLVEPRLGPQQHAAFPGQRQRQGRAAAPVLPLHTLHTGQVHLGREGGSRQVTATQEMMQ